MSILQSLGTAADIPLLIKSSNASSERRINPSWTIAHLKTRLEPITGIPSSTQKLTIRRNSQNVIPIEATDEETATLERYGLQAYAEITVTDTRPPGSRVDYTDVSKVEKYEMPVTEYESRTDSVLAWKKKQNLGRFDPNAPSLEQQKIQTLEREVEERGIAVDLRCQLLPSATDARRGTIKYVGAIPEIPGGLGPWIGIALDEPTGKNDGSIVDKASGEKKRYFECGKNCGVFVRPERVEVGDFPEMGMEDEDMEEM